jgi:hypothetical protein
MSNAAALQAELTTDPLSRGYAGMTDAQVVTSLMTVVDRPVPVDIAVILKFLMLDNTHKTDGTDTQDRPIWRRMKEVVNLNATPDGGVLNPWGSAVLGNISEIQQIKTHQLLDYFTLFAQGNLAVDLQDSNFQIYLAGAESAGCMSTAQKDALLDLSNNQQTRAQELQLGVVYEGDVALARS